MKQQIRIFFTALMFYTRIPCPKWVDHSEGYINKATRYFPLIGWIVGGFAFAFYALFNWQNEPAVGIVFSMIASVWITGAFHEDGFADVCDGFGGGWTKQKILDIMKDSRVGAYGVIGMILLLGLKFLLIFRLSQLFNHQMVYMAAIIISAHSMSRFMAATFIFTHEYSRSDATSKVKPIGKKISFFELLTAAFFGLFPLLIFEQLAVFLLVLPLYLAKWLLGRYFQKWIDGYTGDCLGATQQITEVVFYLSVLIGWKFI
ncbi:adenosylcobinamide-GDP ribazoletransferase [Roseivirga pacifica]|uniref:adenosylcobinamide-GDP ribazoletransferase n=1 Tax=Roseivirga pacifica TaxID=1267423 RepID=UPI00227A6D07|nr:adenosylcobinamide-GDP ribazoletransferase [Roseivirga pacifica]